LYATPHSWRQRHPDIPLEFLPPLALQNLAEARHTIIQNFIANRDFSSRLYSELCYLERDSRFDEPSVQESKLRTDRILWTGLADIDRSSFPQLYFVCHILSAIPYELNVKTQLCA
jgi:hypothetical protein